jgi:ATP-dependent RNA helicase DeaD
MDMYKKFYDFGVSDAVLASLSDMGFEEPTPIQKLSILLLLKGKDVIGQAQTGTGKTAAFGIPIIERSVLRGRPGDGPPSRGKNPYAIILAPTRELAVQSAQELNKIGARSGVSALPVYGGQSIEIQLKGLRKGVDIVVGTPGRVIDHINRRTLILKDIEVVVLDEADEMLNMGFIEDIERILREVPSKRQTMLFSATMPQEILRIAGRYMDKPEHVRAGMGEIVVAKIKQAFYEVKGEDKIRALTRLLDVEDPSLTLVFCHTKREVDEVSGKLQQMGYASGAIHGDFTQAHRDEMMRKFKRGDIDILVATDVAARGLDIPDVSHVINFSIPQDPDGYVHRIGRTGRAGKPGIAITFVTPREYRQLRLIEKTARTQISKARLPSREQVRLARENELAQNIADAIEEGRGPERFGRLAQSLLEKYEDPEKPLAAALSILMGEEEIEEIDELEGGKGKGSSVRLFMTVGKMDKIKVGDIINSITAEAGIPARKIGNIALFDKFSFVEVPADLADRVILAVNDSIIKGRKIRVSHANKRKK